MTRTPFAILLLIAVPGAAACLQELDPNVTGGAIMGPSTATSDSGLVYAVSGVCPPGMIAGGSDGVNADGSPNGGHGVCLPVDKSTPPIMLNQQDDGAATDVACEATKYQARMMRQEHCAGCHDTTTAGQPMGAFGWVLDDDQLTTKLFNGTPLVIAGDPDHSTLYKFVATGLMPKFAPHLPLSDLSILRSWILCLPGSPPAMTGQDDGGGAIDAGVGLPDSGKSDGGATPVAATDGGRG